MNDAEWFAEHAAYLETTEWQRRRSLVLARDEMACQAHLPECTRGATQVHHLTYKHWRNEPLFDLTSVCASCHEAITEMDRAARPSEHRGTALIPLWQRTPLGSVGMAADW